VKVSGVGASSPQITIRKKYYYLRRLLLRQNHKTLQELRDAQNRFVAQNEALHIK
jgi:hypothetical protein